MSHEPPVPPANQPPYPIQEPPHPPHPPEPRRQERAPAERLKPPRGLLIGGVVAALAIATLGGLAALELSREAPAPRSRSRASAQARRRTAKTKRASPKD